MFSYDFSSGPSFAFVNPKVPTLPELFIKIMVIGHHKLDGLKEKSISP